MGGGAVAKQDGPYPVPALEFDVNEYDKKNLANNE